MCLVTQMLARGATMGDVAVALNTSPTTLYRSIQRDPEFGEAVRLGRAMFFAHRAEMVVETALFIAGKADDKI